MGFNCLKATATSRRQFTFYHSVPRNSWYSGVVHVGIVSVGSIEVLHVGIVGVGSIFSIPVEDLRVLPWSQPYIEK